MGYAHIYDLYKSQDILLFKECWALEKVHGTTSRIDFADGRIRYATGDDHAAFKALFDEESLLASFRRLGHPRVRIVGEHYGGAIQAMMPTYGDKERFIAFEAFVGDLKLKVPDAEEVATGLGLEFVPYRKVPTDIASLDAERDRLSEVAVRRGCGEKRREGVVLRPLVELRRNDGEYIIAKHRREEYSERATPQKVVDPGKLLVLSGAAEIAAEWVTFGRLSHVLGKLEPRASSIRDTARVIAAMIEDVRREAAGEIVESKEAMAAIGRRTAELLKERLQSALKENAK